MSPSKTGKAGIEMYSGSASSINDFDCIRRARGNDACKNTFRRLLKERKQAAIRLLNDNQLYFASLFILKPEIEKFEMDDQELGERNRIALNICGKISERKNLNSDSVSPFPLNDEKVHSVLLWMFNTGSADDGLSDEFDKIIDISASILVKTHHEKAILPTVAELIFKRNRKGAYTHDLIWAFFQARDSQSLRVIAGYLRSSQRKDSELAHTLLHLPENLQAGPNNSKENQYRTYLSWLQENSPYLYFTNESFQLTNSPKPCEVNLEAKYLCKDSSPKGRRVMTDLTEEDYGYLNNFSGIQEEEDRAVLANFSNKLHQQDPPQWNQWMQAPIDQQIQVAKYGRREFV